MHDHLAALQALLDNLEGMPDEFLIQTKALQDRLTEGQLHLAVLGQFKRGKSTVINALLGEPVLPDGVLPVTAVPVFLYGAPRPRLEVYTEGSAGPRECSLGALPEYVAESRNLQNEKRVSHVHLYFPSPLLQTGVVLIDTPGIGSTNENNTETTLRFLPQCDAAIVVFSADPPITAAEVDFLQAVRPHVAHFFYVFNKVDYLQPHELDAALDFLRGVLGDGLPGDELAVFPLSARNGLAAWQSGDEAGWQESGMAAFDAHLRDFAAVRRHAVLQQAVQRKAVALIDEAQQLLTLRREALQLPLDELEQTIAAFHGYAGTARRQRADVDDRLAGDEKRLREEIESAAREVRQQVEKDLSDRLAALDLDLPREVWAGQAETITAVLFDRVRAQWRQEVRQELEAIAAGRASEAVALREQLRQAAADLLHVPHAPPLEEESLFELPDPVWVSGTFVPLPQEAPAWERLLPAASRHQRQEQRREKLVEELASRNTERVRWWLLQMVQETLRHLRTRLSETVEQTIAQIELALESAHRQHQDGADSRMAAVTALATYDRELEELRHDMEDDGRTTPPRRDQEASL